MASSLSDLAFEAQPRNGNRGGDTARDTGGAEFLAAKLATSPEFPVGHALEMSWPRSRRGLESLFCYEPVDLI